MSEKASDAIAEDGLPKVDVVAFAKTVIESGPFAVTIGARDVVAIAQAIHHLDEAATVATQFIEKINALAEQPRSTSMRFECMRNLIALERVLIKIGYAEERHDHPLSA